MKGKHHTPESIELIKIARSKQIFSKESIEKRARKLRGRKIPREIYDKIRKSRKENYLKNIYILEDLILEQGEIPYCQCKDFQGNSCGLKVNVKPNKFGSFRYYKKHGYPRFIKGHSFRGESNPMKNPEIVDKFSKIQSISKKELFKDKTKHPRYGKMGSLCPSYIDGRSYRNYCYKFNNRFKEQVRIRDNHICQLCEKTQIKEIEDINKRLTTHHIHYDRENCYPDCIILCTSCNSKVNKFSMRKHYESLFMNKLNDRGLLFWTKYNDRN